MFSVVACTHQRRVSIATSTSLPVSPTSTVTLAPMETSTPVLIPTLSPTPDSPDEILNSPNGEFIAEFANAFSHPAFEPQVIEILDKNSSPLWEIPYQHETAMVDPHPHLSIYGWSKDSLYLYFYYVSGPDGGDFAFWWDGFDLQRINVFTGDIEQVIRGERNGYIAFAFSPDESQIAFTRAEDNPSIIFIRNLSTGTEKTTTVISPTKNYVRVGDFHWSSSGNELAFQTESNDYVAQTIYLDLSTMKQKIVREYIVSTSYFQGWSNDGTLEFLDVEKGLKIVHINPINNEAIVIGTPTPWQ